MIQRQSAMVESLNRAMEQSSCSQRSSPRYQISETEDAFVLSFDVPGVDPKDIDLTFEDDTLTVKATRNTGNSQYKLSQSFTVDPSVDTEKFSAALENGVLVVTAPKDLEKLETEVQKIPVEVIQSTADAKLELNTEETGDELEVSAPEEDLGEAKEEPPSGDEEEINLDN